MRQDGSLLERGSELEREFPYGVVRQLFEPLLQAEAGNGDGTLLAGAAAAARAVFEGVEPGEADAGDSSFAALHGLYWLSVNLTAEGPVLLSIDDLHWCDRASLRFVAYLMHRLNGLPLLIGTTLRTGELCGAAGLMADVRAELNAAGLRPRTATLSGPGSLTASEQRVARLAADGQTNSEIAQTLYVTPKTVEVHLTSVYRKLAIGSRKQLPAALATP